MAKLESTRPLLARFECGANRIGAQWTMQTNIRGPIPLSPRAAMQMTPRRCQIHAMEGRLVRGRPMQAQKAKCIVRGACLIFS
jgi:hypothetical protein